jgi:hypothetical protein
LHLELPLSTIPVPSPAVSERLQVAIEVSIKLDWYPSSCFAHTIEHKYG